MINTNIKCHFRIDNGSFYGDMTTNIQNLKSYFFVDSELLKILYVELKFATL
jgi:hypothetical protein